MSPETAAHPANVLPSLGFKITEVSEGGSVPELRVVSETPCCVLLFDGEDLKGAKQNRILSTTILAEAGSQLDVPVSCTVGAVIDAPCVWACPDGVFLSPLPGTPALRPNKPNPLPP